MRERLVVMGVVALMFLGVVALSAQDVSVAGDVIGTDLKSKDRLLVNNDGPEGDAFVFFYDDGSPTNEVLKWDDVDNRFEFSDALNVSRLIAGTSLNPNHNTFGSRAPSSGLISGDSSVMVGDNMEVGSDLFLSKDLFMEGSSSSGQDGNQTIYFYESGSRNARSFRWADGEDRFELDDAVLVEGSLMTGLSAGTAGVGYNAMGGTSPESGDISNDGDLFVDNDVEVGGDAYFDSRVYVEGNIDAAADGDQHIYFYDGGDRENNYIKWDDSRNDPACSGTSITESAFVWHILDSIRSGWLFTNSSGDIVAKIDGNGDVAIDGTLTSGGGCDLAESFLGPNLEPGTLVAVDPTSRESVVESSEPYQATVMGVVSTEPGLLLNGPTADFYDHSNEWAELHSKLAENPDDLALAERKSELEAMRDGWTRGNLPIALVGRTFVKVDGTYGAIRVGDPLTSSATPGHAMLMDRPGPTIGVALEGFAGQRGEILMLIKSGWYTPGGAPSEASGSGSERAAGVQDEDLPARVADLVDKALARRVGDLGVIPTPSREVEELRIGRRNLADYWPVSRPVEVGDVLVVDRGDPEQLTSSELAADPAVVGVVAGQPGIVTGSRVAAIGEAVPGFVDALQAARDAGDLGEEETVWTEMRQAFDAIHAPVATSGIVFTKVDARYGVVEVGDLLVTSPTKGHAMRANEAFPGTVVGKALQPLAIGTDLIRVLVMLR